VSKWPGVVLSIRLSVWLDLFKPNQGKKGAGFSLLKKKKKKSRLFAFCKTVTRCWVFSHFKTLGIQYQYQPVTPLL